MYCEDHKKVPWRGTNPPTCARITLHLFRCPAHPTAELSLENGDVVEIQKSPRRVVLTHLGCGGKVVRLQDRRCGLVVTPENELERESFLRATNLDLL